LCAAKFVEVLDEAGFTAGVVNLVTGTGSVVGDGLVAHPDIRAISFTGGVDTGKHVYESAAKKMIKVGLELGGKNPIIAMDDANLELLMDGVMFGAFGTAGQRCTAASRLIVHQKIYDDVVDELVERAEKLRIGNPIDEKTDMGPVASADQQKKVLEYIDIGKKEDDKLLTGGAKLTGGSYDRGFFISPTVFAVDRKKRLALEEIFGPVLSVLKAKDYEDAVAIANSVKYGLSSSIYTNGVRTSFEILDPKLVVADHFAGLDRVSIVELLATAALRLAMFRLLLPHRQRILVREADQVDLFPVLARVRLDRDESGNLLDELV